MITMNKNFCFSKFYNIKNITNLMLKLQNTSENVISNFRTNTLNQKENSHVQSLQMYLPHFVQEVKIYLCFSVQTMQSLLLMPLVSGLPLASGVLALCCDATMATVAGLLCIWGYTSILPSSSMNSLLLKVLSWFRDGSTATHRTNALKNTKEKINDTNRPVSIIFSQSCINARNNA